MAASTVCLVVLARTPGHASQWTPVVLVTLVGFLLLGPYSYLAGAMSLDFGGSAVVRLRRESLTAWAIWLDGFPVTLCTHHSRIPDGRTRFFPWQA